MRSDLKEHLDFLCGYISSKENKLLSSSQLELLKSVSNFDDFLTAISGTLFHPIFQGAGPATLLKEADNLLGAEVRILLKTGKGIVTFGILEEITEAYKLLALTDRDKVENSRLFSCGFYAFELLNPEKIPFDDILTEEMLGYLQKELLKEEPFEIDVTAFKARRRLKKRLSPAFGETMSEMIDELNQVDIAFLIFVSASKGFQIEPLIEDGNDRDFSNLTMVLSEEKSFIQKGRLPAVFFGWKSADYFEKIAKAKSEDEAEIIYRNLQLNILEKYKTLVENSVYPFIFLRKLMLQYRLLRSKYIMTFGHKKKEVALS